jgi:hypothetical protein
LRSQKQAVKPKFAQSSGHGGVFMIEIGQASLGVAVDETSRRKGESFVTLVLQILSDLESDPGIGPVNDRIAIPHIGADSLTWLVIGTVSFAEAF